MRVADQTRPGRAFVLRGPAAANVAIASATSPGADNCSIPDEVRANVHVIDPAVPLYEADPDKRLGIRPALGWAALWTAVENIQPSLVIVDPLSAALEGVSVNEGSAVRRFMAAVADASDRFNVGLLFRRSRHEGGA